MKYIINYNEQGKILGFVKGDTDLNIEVSNAIWFEAQSFNKIIIDGKNISFDKVDWKTPENIALEVEKKEEVERKKIMLQGAMYNGYQISFTKDDGDGIVQIKSAFEMGLSSTIIHFDCGTKMPINSSEFNDFALWFMAERNKFFKVD